MLHHQDEITSKVMCSQSMDVCSAQADLTVLCDCSQQDCVRTYRSVPHANTHLQKRPSAGRACMHGHHQHTLHQSHPSAGKFTFHASWLLEHHKAAGYLSVGVRILLTPWAPRAVGVTISHTSTSAATAVGVGVKGQLRLAVCLGARVPIWVQEGWTRCWIHTYRQKMILHAGKNAGGGLSAKTKTRRKVGATNGQIRLSEE